MPKRVNTVGTWDHLLHLAEEIHRRKAAGDLSSADLRGYLGSVAELAAERADPVADYPAYALLRFVRKLDEALADCEKGVRLR